MIIMDLPKCDKNCGAVFHMTQGRHKTNCALHKYDKAVGNLEVMKILILSGEKIPKVFVDALDEFVEL